jgi:hypothetical protein
MPPNSAKNYLPKYSGFQLFVGTLLITKNIGSMSPKSLMKHLDLFANLSNSNDHHIRAKCYTAYILACRILLDAVGPAACPMLCLERGQ